MSDYISREDALLCATGEYADDSFEDSIRETECKKMAKRLKELKPADVRENIHGSWMKINPIQSDDGGAYCCSVCGSGDYSINPNTWKGCPWCLAIMDSVDMRGET